MKKKDVKHEKWENLMSIGERKPEWTEKWVVIIKKISDYIEKTTQKKISVININSGPDPQENFERYVETYQKVKNYPEVVVTVSLPGEERIFWVNQDV
jgi:hypothetical protein